MNAQEITENEASGLIQSDREPPQTGSQVDYPLGCLTLDETTPSNATQGSPQFSKAEMRAKILDAEKVMKAMPLAEAGTVGRIEIPTFHHFAPGVYMREIKIPKGARVVGMIHKTTHLNILSKGRLALATEEGVKIVEASMVVLSEPGVKRLAEALEDSVWITVHPNPTEERDVEKIRDSLVVETFEQLEEFKRKQIIEGGGTCLS